MMTTSISQLMAAEHVADLRRSAEHTGGPGSRPERAHKASVELRIGDRDEAGVIRRLAALDEAPELEGDVLLAIVDGDAVAGLSLQDHRVVADPFVPTREAVALLRLRAEHLSRGRPRRGLRRRLIVR
jgi:hypothetical protein